LGEASDNARAKSRVSNARNRGEPVQPPDLAQYIHEHIPLAKAMGVSVVAVADDAITLQAPFEPNLNHQQTVFGGSASALAILAGWALLHVRLSAAGITDRLVIQRNVVEYQHPITGPFTARSMLEHPDAWRHFTAMLVRKGKARITVLAVLEHMGRVAGRFSGQFVAVGNGGKSGA
jgi:thioesterase domain-containing protein